MIHQLDLRNAVARCIDLPGNGDVPGTGDFNAAMTTSLALSPDGRTLWAVSPGYGRATAIDIATHRVRTVLRFGGYGQGNAGLAAVAPDGRIAATEGTRIWVVEPRRHRVVQSAARTVHALGFGAGGRLWAIGRNAAVYSLRL
jgi:DNA-binding beta-propeller fold protein YncE